MMPKNDSMTSFEVQEMGTVMAWHGPLAHHDDAAAVPHGS